MGLRDAIDAVRGQFRSAPPVPRIEVAGQRVLLGYTFSGLGDAVLLGPVIAALVEAGAQTPIGLLVPKGAARIVRRFALPVRIHDYDPNRKNLRRSYDLAVDLSFREGQDIRSLMRAPTKLGWRSADSTPSQSGLTWSAPDVRSRTDEHWLTSLFRPLRPLSLDGPRRFEWKRPAQADVAARRIWTAATPPAAVAPKKIFVVPGASTSEKRWSPEAFVNVARSVPAGYVVSGAPSERELLEEMSKQVGSAQVYCKPDLAILIALINQADAVLCNDTGPMHIAFCSGIPTVAVFTHMSPTVWGPYFDQPLHAVFGPHTPVEHVVNALRHVVGS